MDLLLNFGVSIIAQGFSLEHNMISHMKKVHGTKGKFFQCDICQKVLHIVAKFL
jgi:hypothetical protein